MKTVYATPDVSATRIGVFRGAAPTLAKQLREPSFSLSSTLMPRGARRNKMRDPEIFSQGALAHMEFRPVIEQITTMDARIFQAKTMGLRPDAYRVRDPLQPDRPQGSPVVNYDGFRLDGRLCDAYFEMVSGLQARYYSTATRYTTSAFMRQAGRGVAGAKPGSPHLRDEGRGQ